MAKFYMTLPVEELSRQVAELLNAHNKLRKKHSMYTIMSSAATYFVDVVGKKVVACQAIKKETVDATRLFHLCVRPEFRNQGLAKKIKQTAIDHVQTPYVYVTIREDNVVSIHINESMGFTKVKREWVGDHSVLTLARLTHVGQGSARVDTKKDADAIRRPGVSPDGLFYTGYKY